MLTSDQLAAVADFSDLDSYRDKSKQLFVAFAKRAVMLPYNFAVLEIYFTFVV